MAVDVLGASHLAGAGWEIQRTNNFEIAIEGVGDSERLLTLSVVSGALPSEHNSPIAIQYGNTTIQVAGTYTIDSGSLVVRDFIQKDVEQLIEAWRSTVYNKDTDAVGFASDYKKQARITQFAPDGTHERVWKIEGVWPSDVDYGSVDQTSNGLKQINITLQYDKARLVRDV